MVECSTFGAVVEHLGQEGCACGIVSNQKTLAWTVTMAINIQTSNAILFFKRIFRFLQRLISLQTCAQKMLERGIQERHAVSQGDDRLMSVLQPLIRFIITVIAEYIRD